GALVMTPPPGLLHQNVSGELYALLREAIQGLGLKVFTAPVAWRIGPGQVPEPDLVVAAVESLASRAVEVAPLLVVEVMSPSGRGRDLFEKRRIYAAGRASWYWLVDPAVPSLTVLRLEGETYHDEAHVVGDEAYEQREPLVVRVVPADLIR
ncbi:MAG: Uma2 family endonuclease, partial [Candidatus Dormibacteraeota bacterium]|nr:Uma2 family endonuclease [Candidatus Dormibacteraeota bacterium]